MVLVYCWYLWKHSLACLAVRCSSLFIPRLLPLSSTSDLGLRAPVVTALLHSCGPTEGLTALRWSGKLSVAWDTCSGCPCYLEGFSHHSVVMSFCIKAYVCRTHWWSPPTENAASGLSRTVWADIKALQSSRNAFRNLLLLNEDMVGSFIHAL